MLKNDRTSLFAQSFSLAIFTSAFLLFMVQPLFSKIILPSLGGATAVWITLMFVYQGLLLLGYGYAHGLSHWVPRRMQVPIHLTLVAASFLMLPLAAHVSLNLPDDAHPIGWLVTTALLGVGLPFFVLSATSPLIQHWFAHTPHGQNKNPYVLYSVSNIGSLLALLGYPLVIERFLPLGLQSNSWLGIYILYAFILAGCGVFTHVCWRKTDVKTPKGKMADPIRATSLLPKTKPMTVLHWLVLALVPSSMLLGVTGFITTQIASLPLLWVVPLALYLSTFILAFAEKQIIPPTTARFLASVGLVGLLFLSAFKSEYKSFAIVWQLLSFFFITLSLHQILASKKPVAAQLTGFYFIMSLGGVLGGAINALLAPLVFNNVYEYPLAIALAGVLLWPYQRQHITTFYESRAWAKAIGLMFDLLVPVALFLLTALPGRVLEFGTYSLNFDIPNSYATAALLVTILALVSLFKPFRLAAGVALVMGGGLFLQTLSDEHTFTKRSFYGTYSVTFSDEQLEYRLLSLGSSAIQGRQSIDPKYALSTTYFYNIEGIQTALPEHIYTADWASIGLGAGTIACLSPKPNKTTFIEIDPTVLSIARDSGYFTYLRDCPGQSNVILGDGRAKLDKDFAPHSLGLIALDAFSGASVPTHILTLEAFKMYLSKLQKDGVLLVNLSNSHVDFLKLIATQTEALGIYGVHRKPIEGASTFSHWAVLSPSKATLAKLKATEGWEPLPAAHKKIRPWTDSFATILPLLK